MGLGRSADLVWATTWIATANTFIAPRLGMPRLPYVDLGSSAAVVDDASPKTSAVFAFAGDRPFAWLDNDLGAADFARAKRRSAVLAPTLLVHVNDRTGATGQDYAAVGSWLDALHH